MIATARYFGIKLLMMGGVIFLIILSTIILRSLNPSMYPMYFVYIVSALVIFFIFSSIDFDIFMLFSKHLFVISLFLLLLPLIIGQATRGTIRWIPLGPISIQPSELVRPYLLLYFAVYLTEKELDLKRLIKSFLLFSLPFILILIQPSLGVAVLTAAGFLGALLASNISKKYLFIAFMVFVAFLPVFWFFLADYQKTRVTSFLNPSSDPYGTGYNSVQSMIAVGSGKLLGRGLGEGVQTQLLFLPEKHTDFIFAAIAEEMGFVGSFLLLLGLFVVLYSLIYLVENSQNPTARAYVTAVFLVLLAETVIHIGMNMQILPITGVPLPFVSAGGSALLGTSAALGMAAGARKK